MRAFEGPLEWGRLLTALVTPFSADGTVNYSEAARIAAYVVDEQKNDGLVVAGTTGESPTLSEEEKLRLLDVILDAVGDRASVLFGAGTYNTAESILMTRSAEKHGAHGIMLVNPYYNRPGQAGLYAHFSTVARETSLPVLLYNIHPRSSINLDTSTLLRLIEDVPNIAGVKEASGNMAQIQEVAANAPEGFLLYSGDDALSLPILSVGGHGVISVAAHIVGREIADMISSFVTDPHRSMAINRRLLPVYKALFSAPSPVPVKFALSLEGFLCEDVRLPLVNLSDEERNAVRDSLNSFVQNRH